MQVVLNLGEVRHDVKPKIPFMVSEDCAREYMALKEQEVD